MKPTEVVKLAAIIRALCPTQKFDEFTTDAWATVLDDIPFTAAQEVVRTIYREQGSDAEWIRKIEADDIIREVKRKRNARINAHPHLIPPPGLSVAEETAWLRRARRAVGDGQAVPDTRGELVERPEIRLALAARPVKRDVQRSAGHEITQSDIDRALAQVQAARAASKHQEEA